jgi:serine/threonine protein kinase
LSAKIEAPHCYFSCLQLFFIAGGVDEVEFVKIALGVAKTMEAAHEQKYMHRDLKPPNVVIRKDGTPVIVDWGLAVNLKTSSPNDANIGTAR